MIITGDFKIKEEENHYYNFNTNIWKDSWSEDGEEESKKFTSDFKTNIFVISKNIQISNLNYFKPPHNPFTTKNGKQPNEDVFGS